jgi:hypothetical protein
VAHQTVRQSTWQVVFQEKNTTIGGKNDFSSPPSPSSSIQAPHPSAYACATARRPLPKERYSSPPLPLSLSCASLLPLSCVYAGEGCEVLGAKRLRRSWVRVMATRARYKIIAMILTAALRAPHPSAYACATARRPLPKERYSSPPLPCFPAAPCPPASPLSVDKRHTLCSNALMKLFDFEPEFAFDPEKNQVLQATRGISFEEIIARIEAGYAVRIYKHPNPEKYPAQEFCEVNMGDYIFVVPLIIDGRRVFLKTIFPSRKATRNHKKGTLP